MKHPHAEMIIEWANDTSKVVQILNDDDDGSDGLWADVRKPSWDVHSEYRFKPREFNEGEWYPCVYQDGDECVRVFKNGKLYAYSKDPITGVTPDKMKWIGESLGKLKFGN